VKYEFDKLHAVREIDSTEESTILGITKGGHNAVIVHFKDNKKCEPNQYSVRYSSTGELLYNESEFTSKQLCRVVKNTDYVFISDGGAKTIDVVERQGYEPIYTIELNPADVGNMKNHSLAVTTDCLFVCVPAYEHTDDSSLTNGRVLVYSLNNLDELITNALRTMNKIELDFGKAIRALKDGKRVARKGWNGKNMWLALTMGTTIDRELARSGAVLAAAKLDNSVDQIVINSHIDMLTADGSICCGWLASQSDMLSEDWVILD